MLRVKYFKMMDNNVCFPPDTDPNFMSWATTELLMPNSPLTHYQHRTGWLSMMIPHWNVYSISSPSPSNYSRKYHFSTPDTQKSISSHIHQGWILTDEVILILWNIKQDITNFNQSKLRWQIHSTLPSPYFMADTITIFTRVKTAQICTETDFVLSF